MEPDRGSGRKGWGVSTLNRKARLLRQGPLVERSLGVGFAPQAHFQRRSHAYVPNSSRGVRRCVRGGARGDSGCRAHQSGVRLRFRHARCARLGGPRKPRGGAERQQQGPPRRGIAGAAHRPAAGGRRSAVEGHWCRPSVRCDAMRCRAVGWMCNAACAITTSLDCVARRSGCPVGALVTATVGCRAYDVRSLCDGTMEVAAAP